MSFLTVRETLHFSSPMNFLSIKELYNSLISCALCLVGVVGAVTWGRLAIILSELLGIQYPPFVGRIIEAPVAWLSVALLLIVLCHTRRNHDTSKPGAGMDAAIIGLFLPFMTFRFVFLETKSFSKK